MKCLTPILLPIYKYKHFAGEYICKISGVDYFVVPCGKCVECLAQDAKDWTLRMMLEYEVSDTAWFITLTFDEEHCPISVTKDDTRRFMNSMRQKYKRMCADVGCSVQPLKYFVVGEYGRESGRPHYHIMLFNFPCRDWRALQQFCEEIWHRGFVKVEPCTFETSGYVAKYLTKIDPRPHEVKPYRTMSLKPAIGFRYFDQHPEVVQFLEQSEIPVLTLRNGKKFRVPRSIRRKFYSNEKKMRDRTKAAEQVSMATFKEISEKIRVGKEENTRRLNKLKSRFK